MPPSRVRDLFALGRAFREGLLRRIVFAVFALVCVTPVAAYSQSLACHDRQGYYVNSDGRMVHRPKCTNHHESGETAICRDGSHSFSLHHDGTCSHHGGVATWE